MPGVVDVRVGSAGVSGRLGHRAATATTQLTNESTATFFGREVFSIENFVRRAHPGTEDRPAQLVPPGTQRFGLQRETIGVPRLELDDAFECEPRRIEVIKGHMRVLFMLTELHPERQVAVFCG